jgi:hypothetical protein
MGSLVHRLALIVKGLCNWVVCLEGDNPVGQWAIVPYPVYLLIVQASRKKSIKLLLAVGLPSILGSSQFGHQAVPVKAPTRPGWVRLVVTAWEHPQFEADNKTAS